MCKHQRYLHQSAQTPQVPYDLSHTVDNLMNLAQHLSSQSHHKFDQSEQPDHLTLQTQSNAQSTHDHFEFQNSDFQSKLCSQSIPHTPQNVTLNSEPLQFKTENWHP